jgi:hypothetical protein
MTLFLVQSLGAEMRRRLCLSEKDQSLLLTRITGKMNSHKKRRKKIKGGGKEGR